MPAFKMRLTVACVWMFLSLSYCDTTQKEATLGQKVKLPCYVDSTDVQVQWLDKDGMQISFGSDVTNGRHDHYRVDHPYPRDWNLEISSVRTDDAGVYQCRIGTAPPTTKYIELKVQVPPTVVNSSRDTTAAAGSQLTLECFAAGTPEPRISWYRHTAAGQRVDLGVVGNAYVIDNIDRQSSGVYECFIDNGVKPTTFAKMRVDVLFAPEVSVPYRGLSQKETDTVIMTCLITANPFGNFTWRRAGGDPLVNSHKYHLSSVPFGEYQIMFTATIYDLESSDYGVYDCIADNEFGSSSDKITISEFQTGRIRILSPPKDVIVSVGSDTTVLCSVDTLPPGDSLAWWRKSSDSGVFTRLFLSHGVQVGDISLIDSDKYSIEGQYNLVVKATTFDDAGVYMCEISGHHNYTAELSVLGPLKCNEASVTVDDGVRAELGCSLAYSGPVDSTWRVDWLRADTERRLPSFTKESGVAVERTLLLTAEYPSSDADYVCLVSSRRPLYHDNCTTHLYVRPNRAGNSSAICQEPGYFGQVVHSSQTVILLSLIITLLVITLIVTVACLITKHRHKLSQLRAGASIREVELKPLKTNGSNV